MNLNTAITTPARRLAREINRHPAATSVAFDAEGYIVGAWSTGTWFADSSKTPDHSVVVTGRRAHKMTEREAQDLLDAAAWANQQRTVTCEVIEDASPVTYSHVEGASDYLAALAGERDLARYRHKG
jgi:hypothetical protein